MADYLLRLVIGSDFDDPITGLVWPASLLQLAFGNSFNQPIAEVVWPDSVNLLLFGDKFSKSISRSTTFHGRALLSHFRSG